MEALELEVWAPVDVAAATAVDDLMARIERATGLPGLSEDRLRALRQAAEGDRSTPVTGVSARRPGSSEFVGWAQIDGPGGGRMADMEVVVYRGPDERGSGEPVLDPLIDAALVTYAATGSGSLRWWVNHASEADDVRATARGFITERDLLQLRCALPLPDRCADDTDHAIVSISTRAFRVGVDEVAWLIQNNRAFADHPEQGRWDRATLEARQSEIWFDPQGFRVLEVDGRIAGSCWTKVHGTGATGEGEIYVIGVDPDFHGRGWGRALAEDGFAWLASRGIRVGMLYVDAANAAAVGLYTSMGMTVDHIDRSYVNPSVAASVKRATREPSTP